ncbi:MAG: fibronectin type III domain-containing protein, partial [Actinomycetota bacterium]
VTFMAPACSLPTCPAITGYTVTSNPAGGVDSNAGSTSLSHLITGLANGTTYTFTVTAANSVGAGPPSGASNAVTPATLPGAPQNTVASAGNTSATVTFNPPASDGGAAITGYTATAFFTSSGFTAGLIGTGIASPILVTGLTNGTAYFFKVTANNSVGTGLSASTLDVTPTGGTVPDAPTIGTATVQGSGTVRVTFTPPGNDGGSAITSYNATSSHSGIFASGAGSPIDVSGLTNGTAYTFTVTATNAVGTSLPSSASNSVTPAAPPSQITPAPVATATGVSGQVSIAFTVPSNNGSAITSYTVFRQTGAGGPVSVSGGASPIVFNGLTDGNAYTFTVAATNASGTGTLSAQSNSATPLISPAACSATTPVVSGGLSLRASPARTTGISPLAVFFDATPDATPTTSTATTRPFHDIEYRWNFGDPGSGTWSAAVGVGNTSRNVALGAVAGHVYEPAAGAFSGGIANFTAVVTAFDGTDTASCSIAITVQDPEVAFAGNKTTCFSTSGNFTGCPTGANQVTTPTANFVTVLNAATSGNTVRRLLLRRGETWLAATNAVLKAPGPGLVGAFGTGAAPAVVAGGDITMFELSSPTTPGITDWRIMDLELNGNGHTQSIGIDPNGGIDQVTILRVNSHDNHNPFRFNSGILDFWNANGFPGHTIFDQIAIVDSQTTNVLGASAALSVYASASRFMMLGNDMNNNGGGEHTVRFPSIVRGVMSNNLLQGQSTGLGGKHAFTLRAAVNGSAGVEGGKDTQYVMISDNRFIGNTTSGQTVTIQPQGAVDERIVDAITERNWFTAFDPANGTQVSLFITAREQTIRNNVFDTTNGKAHTAIFIAGTTNISDQIRVYNNTAYSADVDSDFQILEQFITGVTNVTAINNLGYSPNDTQHQGIACNGSSNLTNCIVQGLVTGGNSSAAAVLTTNPQFTSVSPFTPANAKPTAGSYAIAPPLGTLGGILTNPSTGKTVPVWSDFFLAPQPAGRTIGAVNP